MRPFDDPTRPASHRRSIRTLWPAVALVAIVAFVGLIRVRLLDFPLERDEGEYAYAGQLILHGLAPYQLCHTMKLPGTAAAYALAMAIFGQTTEGVHLGLLLVNSATIVLMYILASRLLGRPAGIVAAASFALLSLQPAMLGFAGHATHFVLLPALGGLILLLKGIESQKPAAFLASGLLLGLGFLMKQPGVFFIFFALAYLVLCLYRGTLGRRQFVAGALMLCVGALIPFGLTCILMLAAGALEPFWFWTIEYSSKYAAILTLADGAVLFLHSALYIVLSALALWLMAAAGLARLLTDRQMRDRVPFILGFLAFSFLAICPGLYFRPHYFLLGLPAAALLCGVVVAGRGGRLVSWVLVAAAFGLSLMQSREFLFLTPPIAASMDVYGSNPFAQLPAVAALVEQHTSPKDRIAVIGSEPELYFYTRRLSATGYMYMYPLMEPQPFASTMQREMVSQIETAAPEMIVLVKEQMSWLERPDSDRYILSWSEDYLRAHYRAVDISSLAEARVDHLSDVETEEYRSGYKTITVYERVE